MSTATQLKVITPAQPVMDFQAHAASDASLMLRSGRAIGEIAALISENTTRLETEGSDFLSPSALSGLLDAVQLIAGQLAERGEDLGELVDAEDEQ